MKNGFTRVVNKLAGFFRSQTPKGDLFFTRDHLVDHSFDIGEFTYGCPNVLYESDGASLHIGKFCSIAAGVTIFLGGNHRTDWVTTYPFSALPKYFPEAESINGHPSTNGDVRIANDVWVGRNVTIMSGVSVGNGAVIAAGSMVTRDIGPYEVWGGNPARLIKERFDKPTIEYLESLKWWDWDIDKVKANLHILCSSEIGQFEI